MHIQLADFTDTDLQQLLREYLDFAHQDDCTHALSLSELEKPDVQMFTARDETRGLMGCAAIKTLNTEVGEIKSVYTHRNHLRKGVSRKLMTQLEQAAELQGLGILYLETHNTPQYMPACRLYESLGYQYCEPFSTYTQNPRNVFMKKTLS